MDFMLQRKMDSSVDYGTPLVVAKTGWFQKIFDHEVITEKIPVITSKVPDQSKLWSKLKYLASIETPIRVAGVVILGTLLGAAYAVTTQSGDKQSEELSVPALETQGVAPQELAEEVPTTNEHSTSSSDILLNDNETSIHTALEESEISNVLTELNFSQAITTAENTNNKITLALKSPEINQEEAKESSLKLLSTKKGFKITHPKGLSSSKKVIDEATYTAIVIPKELIPDVVEDSNVGLSKYEQQRIMELEKKLALAQKKLDKFDMENLKLQGKFETLVVKNRALSDQLRHIDTVTTELKNR